MSKNILITGVGSGFGERTVRELRKRGYTEQFTPYQ